MKLRSAPQVFINYRSDDTGTVAAALERELAARLNHGLVFLDHRSLDGGEPWPGRLREMVGQSEVFLALIGHKWLTLQGDDGIRRLDEPDDWVRQEIEGALANGKRIVPVFVDNAGPLREHAFRTEPTKSLLPLVSLHGISLRTKDWESDVDTILGLLEQSGFRRTAGQAGAVPDGSVVRAFTCTVPSRGEAPFEGRDPELAALVSLLSDPAQTRFVVLAGPSGVGKSELAFEYARRSLARYPGGVFLVDASSAGPPPDLATLGRIVLHLRFDTGLKLEDQCMQAVLALGTDGCLVIYDNAVGPSTLAPWLPRAGARCHVIVTSTERQWDDRWKRVHVSPLARDDSDRLARACAGDQVALATVAEIVRTAVGLPIQLVSAARAARIDAEHGRAGIAPSGPSAETASSFDRVWRVLGVEARLLIATATFFRPESVPRNELRHVLTGEGGWDARVFEAALDRCLDLTLLEGEVALRSHQLLWEFILSMLGSLDVASWARVCDRIASRFLEAASRVRQNPGDSEAVAAFLAFRSDPPGWSGIASVRLEDPGSSHRIGRSFFDSGRFEEARPWFERAVAKAEKGDVHGRVDHESLGVSVHLVGSCLSSLGRFEAALPWFERAVTESEKGDTPGHVDHDSLGSSVHQVGFCLSELGRFEAALPWFERALAEAEKGDILGRVDHDSLGSSVEQVGVCLSELGRFDDARPWFERAVLEKEKGDVHGRVDHASLGFSVTHVGSCLSSLGRFDDARPWFQRAVVERENGDARGRVNHAGLGSSVHQVGSCLSDLGRFDEARPWFERAVAEKEKGDVHGYVDHASLGRSVHQVGFCLSSLGRFEDARPWFERAVAEAEKGDVHGRVDHADLGVSVHQVGFCLSELGRFEEARPWFERAVAEAEKGDVHGRLDHGTRGISVYQVGFCLSGLGRFEEALPWFELAVAESEKGDVHGRVNHASLGRSVHRVGYCLSELGRLEEAMPWFARAVAEAETGDVHGRVDHETLGSSVHQIGFCLSGLGRFEEALPSFERALAEAEKGDVHGRVSGQDLLESMRSLATCLSEVGRTDEANALRRRIASIEKTELG